MAAYKQKDSRQAQKIDVVLDERVRTFTAVLAASDWPEIEQAQKPHAVHPHSKQTRHFVSSHSDHEAVSRLNQALASGQTLAQLLTAVLQNAFALTDFQKTTDIEEAFWPEYAELWQTAVQECATIFANSPIPHILQAFGVKPTPIQLMPTLSYPMLDPVVASLPERTFLLLPPPKAWGESPPWPFQEDPIWVVVEAGRALFSEGLTTVFNDLPAERRAELVQAAVAICLGQMFDTFEQQAFVVRIKKEMEMPNLPQIADKLAQWLASPAAERQPLTAGWFTNLA